MREHTITNDVPVPTSKWLAAPVKGSGENAAWRKVAVERTYYDDVRQDTRIEYVNLETGRHGATWYATFKSRTEFKPMPVVTPDPVVETSIVTQVVPPPAVSPVQPTQMQFDTTFRLTDPALLAEVRLIRIALETIARGNGSPVTSITKPALAEDRPS